MMARPVYPAPMTPMRAPGEFATEGQGFRGRPALFMKGAVDFVEVAQAEQDEEQGGLGDGDGHGGGGVGDAAVSGKDGGRQQALDRAGGVGDKLKTIGGSQDLRREDRCAPTGDDDFVSR